MLLVLFFIFLVNVILGLEFVNSIRNNSEGLFKTIHWGYMQHTVPVLYGLLFVVTPKLVIKRTKYLIYPLIYYQNLNQNKKLDIW